jgi:hypothetical protein
MQNYHQCQANAAECERMAAVTVNTADKATWQELAFHWHFLSPQQDETIPIKADRPGWKPTLLGT